MAEPVVTAALSLNDSAQSQAQAGFAVTAAGSNVSRVSKEIGSTLIPAH